MKTLALFFALLTPIVGQTQQLQELSFLETNHSFGTINEVDGPVEYKFEFTNTGSQPITITNVRPSCGLLLQVGQKKRWHQEVPALFRLCTIQQIDQVLLQNR